MKQIVLSVLMLCFFSQNMHAQKKSSSIRVQCRILDADSTDIENANAAFESASGSVFSSVGTEGIYLPGKGVYKLLVQAVGYYDQRLSFGLYADTLLTVYLRENVVEHNNVTVKAIHVREKSGFVYSKLTARQISAANLGQDLTYLLGNTPSAVSTSDAGTGIGYTGIRIRGSDGTRINVTINGVPVNDAESHGVFWVNMPDLASSASQIQVQRGVGSSTIGSGAFGANINIQNTELSAKPFLQLQQSAGSFNTVRSTLQFGTGRLGSVVFGGRLSRIVSDGYIDRGASDLQAFQFNLNFLRNKWSINAVSFGGKEKTYQSWYGTPESRVNGDVAEMNRFADRNYLSDAERSRLLNSGRTYNYYTYPNQTDNYWQNHYQLHIARELKPHWLFKSSNFVTTGKGYYEEFKADASFAAYGVADYSSGSDTVTATDLVRQRWLDNVFFGSFTTLNYQKGKLDLIGGLSYTEYRGKHFGDVIWASLAQPFGKDFRYYSSTSRKTEYNGFVKGNVKITKRLQADLEMQARHIQYRSEGNDNDLKRINFDTGYLFFNPKIGLVFDVEKGKRIYGSYSIGQREPVRSDFIDNAGGNMPSPEFLQDLELGFIYRRKTVFIQLNMYHMDYRNQLVLTGELNDVGSSLRRNVPKSFRQGIELMLQYQPVDKLTLEGNMTLSRNRIAVFDDIYYNYDSGTIISDRYEQTDIAFSPSVIGFVGVSDRHLRGLELNLNCKYVGKQYLDNTLNKFRSLDAYYTLNFSFQKAFKLPGKGQIMLKGMVSNLTGIFYSNNGYTYKYVYSGNLITENFYYPQSRTAFMLGLDFKIL